MLPGWLYNRVIDAAEKEERTVTLKDVLDSIPNGDSLSLATSHPASVSYMPDVDFYIEPQVSCLACPGNSRVILLSAPGATGKSTLARHLARERNALLWDLSKEKIANHSLSGMIVKALGAKAFSSFTCGLNTSKAVLIIDALDEAEMISGSAAVETLLQDISELITDSSSPTVVLCARTETAHKVAYYCEEVCHLPIAQYEIGHFDEAHAKEFVLTKLKLRTSVTPAIQNFVDASFGSVRKCLGDEAACRSFLGYAPVLEALAAAYDPEINTLHQIRQVESTANSTALFDAVMRSILEREQSKVTNAFKQKCADRYPRFHDWEKVYTPEEQLMCIAYFLIFDEIASDCCVSMSPELAAEYSECVESFLWNHPFLRTGNFAGPAFRDYTLARLMLMSESDMFVDSYLSDPRYAGCKPAQLFFEFYAFYANKVADASHFSLLYSSFKAKETLDTISSVSVTQEGESLYCTFSQGRGQKDPTVTEIVLCVGARPLCVSQLTNAVIDINGDLVLGVHGEDVSISSSTVNCRKLVVRTATVYISGSQSAETFIGCTASMDTHLFPHVQFNRREEETAYVKLDIPEVGKWYFLRDCAYKHQSDAPITVERFENIVRSLLHPFRKHGKDAPGKHREYVENVVVGNSKPKQSVYQFFLDIGALYRDAKDMSQLKLDNEKLEMLGLNWGYMSHGFPHTMSRAYQEYITWYSSTTEKHEERD